MSDKTDNLEKFLENYGWMMRPCDSYNHEYTECAGIKARLHQLYVFGETRDCRDWKSNYRDCNNYVKNKDLQAAKRVIDFERNRREARMKAHFANNVWEHRTEPPDNWNTPLPEWMQKTHDESYLGRKQAQLEENPKQLEIDRNKWCRLM